MNKMLITNAGLAEIVNAEQSGTAPVVLSHVAFGTGQYTATADLTKLKSEFKRFDAVAGSAISDNMIHLTVHDNSADKYTVNEVGVFTASGTLFAVISQTTPIMEKSATSESMLAIDITLTDIDASSISFGDTNIVLNPATTDTAGIVELATDAEAKTGTDTTRAMTPAAAKAARDADANIVHRTGNETIAGKKTFTSATTVKCATPSIFLQQTDTTKGTTPASDQYSLLYSHDSAGSVIGAVGSGYQTNGEIQTFLQVYKPTENSTQHAKISIVYPADGSPYATAPTPAAGDNSTKIATTQWANAKFLPLAGGTMTGAIVRQGTLAYSSVDTGAISLLGGPTDNKCGQLNLFGGTNPDRAGQFVLRAGTADGYVDLQGTPNGVLSWQNKNIVRSVNGTAADASGNVEMPVGIENTATGTNSLTLLGTATASSSSINIGPESSAEKAASIAIGLAATTSGTLSEDAIAIGRSATATRSQTVAVGRAAKAEASYAVAIGYNSQASSSNSVGLGWAAKATSLDTIQIGQGTNSTMQTMQVWNYTLLDKNTGLIPAERITGFLPTSGGAMTATKAITRDVNDSYLGLHGGTGTDNDGAQLDLCGANHSSMPGTFQLHARTSDKDVILRGQTDGKLTWGDKYILTNSYVATVDNGAVMLTAGTQSVKGAYLRLYGADHSTGAGTFAIAASDGTTSKSLTGNADGTLTWGGNKVVVLVAEQKPTSSNNYTWYRKYSDGWVEQGGTAASGSSSVTFPVVFADAGYYFNANLTNGGNGTTLHIISSGYTTTGCTLKEGQDGVSQRALTKEAKWFACGYAKQSGGVAGGTGFPGQD